MARRSKAATAENTTEDSAPLAEAVDEVIGRAEGAEATFNPSEFESQGEEGEAPPREQPKPMSALGKSWTQRYAPPSVKYAHSTFKDAMGKEHIAFRFDLPPGQTKPDDAIIEVMRDHKFFRDGKPNGLAPDARDDSESFPTGLHFDTVRGGKAWLLPNTEMGRNVADSINQALDGLAKRVEPQGHSAA
jgi:hypothetical protein